MGNSEREITLKGCLDNSSKDGTWYPIENRTALGITDS